MVLRGTQWVTAKMVRRLGGRRCLLEEEQATDAKAAPPASFEFDLNPFNHCTQTFPSVAAYCAERTKQ